MSELSAVERHPWNTSFEWENHPGPFTTVSRAQAKSFDDDGYFVAEGVLGDDEVARTLEEIDVVEAKTEAWLRGRRDERAAIAEAGAITFTTHLVKQSDWLRSLAGSPTLAGIARDLLGPAVRLYWDQAVYKKPEKPRRFPWHQDNGYTFVEPQQYLTCWVALTDATLENGCPQVAPGLHRMGTLRHVYIDPLGYECLSDHPSPRIAEVRAGGAVVFSSLTPHLTGPNTTEAVRKAYILQYAPDGAMIQRGDPDAGPPTSTEPADDPDRQFLITSA